MKKITVGLALLILISACKHQAQKSDNENTVPEMKIEKEVFGTINGKEVFLYTLKNSKGFTVEITNYGGIVTSILTADKKGNFDDVVLGYDNLQEYLIESPYFGAIVGRYANRIRNANFKLDGKTIRLSKNENQHHLHGGKKGFDKQIWEPQTVQDDSTASLILTYFSPDGEEGYPGNLDVKVIYTVTRDNKLQIEYTAKTDKPTPVNLSHHGYFNLGGTSGRNILDHVLYLDADKFAVTDSNLLPTGELLPVVNTPMDFRVPERIGSRIHKVSGGYDHNFVLNNEGKYAKVAELFDQVTGRFMEVFTTEPGIQFYSGNFLDGKIVGETGLVYSKHHGLCLETQHFPDSPNQPEFPNTILKPGDTYKQFTVYRFGVKGE
jgi:aldose 1-epimerase